MWMLPSYRLLSLPTAMRFAAAPQGRVSTPRLHGTFEAIALT